MSQLLDTACTQLRLPTEYTTLLVNGEPLVKCPVSTLYGAGIDDKTVLEVLAKQPVSLRCHHLYIPLSFNVKQDVDFEPGKPLRESRQPLRDVLVSCHTSLGAVP